jgi:hypothetical protein
MDSKHKQTALSTASRVRRVITGSVFIGIVMNASGPLGYLTLLPLLAVYPILTGLFGEDPIDGLLANWQGGFEGRCFRPSTRVGLLALGVAAIGAMMLSPDHIGIRALLAFASLYPVMAGLFGEDLISLALGFGQEKQPATRVSPRVHKTHRPRKPVVARHHWFGHGAGPKAA